MKLQELNTRIEQAISDYEHNKFIIDRFVIGMFFTFVTTVLAFVFSNFNILYLVFGILIIIAVYKCYVKKYTDMLLGHQNYVQGLYSIKVSLIQGRKTITKREKQAYGKFINQYNIIAGVGGVNKTKRLESVLKEEGINLKQWVKSGKRKR